MIYRRALTIKAFGTVLCVSIAIVVIFGLLPRVREANERRELSAFGVVVAEVNSRLTAGMMALSLSVR